MTDTQDEITPPKSSCWARTGIFISTLAIIISLGVFVYGYFQLSQLAKTMQNQDTNSQQAISDMQNKITSFQQSLQKTEDLSAQQEKLMTEWRAAQSGDMNAWHLAQAEYLVKMANDQLQYAGNTKTALELMQQADKELQVSKDPALLDVRKSIASDITNLEALPQVDAASVFVQMSAVNKLVDKLPLPIQPLTSDEQQTSKSPETSKWKGAFNAAWQGLNKIVIVRKNDTSALPLVLPDEKIFLYQNLHAQLESANWGLLHQNKTVYDGSLVNAIAWIEQYFVQEAPETKNILQQLAELQKVNVAPPTMNLAKTMQLLEDTLAKMKGHQESA